MSSPPPPYVPDPSNQPPQPGWWLASDGKWYPPQPAPAAAPGYRAPDPQAPFGYDPVSGQPYSDKQKTAAGILQLFFPGVGRLMIGYQTIGLIQLILWVTSFPLMCFGIGLFTLIGVAIWAFVDGILILVGNVKDPQGRPLRP